MQDELHKKKIKSKRTHHEMLTMISLHLNRACYSYGFAQLKKKLANTVYAKI